MPSYLGMHPPIAGFFKLSHSARVSVSQPCSWRHTPTTCFPTLPNQINLIQLISSLVESPRPEIDGSDRGDKGDIQNVHCCCASRNRVLLTINPHNPILISLSGGRQHVLLHFFPCTHEVGMKQRLREKRLLEQKKSVVGFGFVHCKLIGWLKLVKTVNFNFMAT